MWTFFAFFSHLGARGFPVALLSHFGSVMIGLAGICVITACGIRAIIHRNSACNGACTAVESAEVRAELGAIRVAQSELADAVRALRQRPRPAPTGPSASAAGARPNGHDTSGLDAEVIMLARRISDKLGE